MAKNILICDDAAFMRMMIKDILTKNGYNIAGEAENGAKAVEKYAELKPDLVLMDITMPEMDGIEALKKIKETDPNAAVIMCSAMGQQAMVIESIQSGAKDFIVKPFQADRVTRFVGNYQKNKLSGSNIQILETMRISNTKYIQVIKVGGKCFAIAVTKDNVSFLCELNEDELIYNSSSDTGTINKESFKAVLEKFKKDKPEG